MTFGKWLLSRREQAGLTQLELAIRAGISANYVSALERDEPNARDGSPRRPRVEKVDRIARAVGVSVNEARIAAGFAPAGSVVGDPDNIYAELDALSDEDRMVAVSLIHSTIATLKYAVVDAGLHEKGIGEDGTVGSRSEKDVKKRKAK